jgi:hypothetical protein
MAELDITPMSREEAVAEFGETTVAEWDEIHDLLLLCQADGTVDEYFDEITDAFRRLP